MILFSKKATLNNLLAFLNLLSVFFFFKKRMLKPVLVFEKLDFQRTWFPLKAVEMKLDAYTTLILYGKHFYKAACKRSAQLEHVYVSSG